MLPWKKRNTAVLLFDLSFVCSLASQVQLLALLNPLGPGPSSYTCVCRLPLHGCPVPSYSPSIIRLFPPACTARPVLSATSGLVQPPHTMFVVTAVLEFLMKVWPYKASLSPLQLSDRRWQNSKQISDLSRFCTDNIYQALLRMIKLLSDLILRP